MSHDTEQFRTVHNSTIKAARSALSAGVEVLDQYLIVYDAEGRYLLSMSDDRISAVIAVDPTRALLVKLIHATLEQIERAAFVMYAAEGLMVSYDKDQSDLCAALSAAGVPVSERRNREECLMLAFYTLGGVTIALHPITREGDTRRLKDKPFDDAINDAPDVTLCGTLIQAREG